MTELTAEQMDKLASSLRAGEYNLLVGAGISLKSIGGDGKELPTGEGLRGELCTLKAARANTSLQRVYELLDQGEVDRFITARFSRSDPGPAICKVPTFPWRRIFTLNVDDAVEQAYADAPAMQELTIFNYKDPFQDSREIASVPIIHLHGYSRRPNDGYVFSRTSYVNQVSRGSSWMAVLADLMAVEPFIVIGTALDEPDLDFYLARRSAVSSRSDKGPGIFVEPFPDSVTIKDCEKHDLVLYKDTAESFFDYLDQHIKQRVPPVELITQASAGLFPVGVDKISQAKFLADFELVPVHAQENSEDPRFLLGHEPTWSDLESQLDISRSVSTRLSTEVRRILESDDPTSPKIVYLPDEVGGGKSTVVRRTAFNLARLGYRVINCLALGRIEPAFTTSMLDLIDGPLVVIVDNFADQVSQIAAVINAIEKVDIVFLCTERSYRAQYLSRLLSGTDVIEISAQPLSKHEVRQLIETYVAAGMIGNPSVTKQPDTFASRLRGDPIAVACCRILNDFQPMVRIVESVLAEATKNDKDRYLAASLAQFCINGGIRYDLLVAVSGSAGLRNQLGPYVSLPLTFSEDGYKNYVVPLNGVIGSRVLDHCARASPETMLDLFCRMGKVLAPRVNRETITRRLPEARLAGRLFDFDQVTERFLGPLSETFYTEVQREWQWNSRYWEQVALLNLGKFYKQGEAGVHYLEAASQHARHAVSIEHHPFPLTTLGKVLFAEFRASNFQKRGVFDEALARLAQAIDLERQWNWNSTQAYMIVFRGAIEAVSEGLSLSGKQAEDILAYMRFVRSHFVRDRELQDARTALEALISN